MKFDSRAKAIYAALLAQVIWGVAGLLVKVVLDSVPPFSLLFLRSLFTCLILYPVLEYRVIKAKFLPSKSELIDMPGQHLENSEKWEIFWAAFTGVVLNIGLYFVGQKLTTVIDAWIINSTGALTVIVISYIFLRERLAKIVYAGVTLAFLGTVIIVGTPILQAGSGSFLGNILMLGSVTALSISYILTKKLTTRFSPLLLTYYFFLTGMIFSLPLFIWEFLQNPSWIASLPPSAYPTIAYLTIGSSILAYSLDNFALTHLSASITATIGYVSVVVAVALGIIFLHEAMTPFFIIGTVLTFAGLFLAETRHAHHPMHKIIKKPNPPNPINTNDQ